MPHEMASFGLLLGHLVGDYLVQNDWMAANKTNPWPGPKPQQTYLTGDGKAVMSDTGAFAAVEYLAWCDRRGKWRRGHLACTAHCLAYTIAVWACSFWWMPWWGLVVCFVAHWPIDRFRLAGWWMKSVAGQKAFATGVLAPWSIIVVDNTFHLLTLFAIGLLYFR